MPSQTKQRGRFSPRRLFPLEALPRKMKLRIWRDLLRRESITAPVLDFRMEMPLRFAGLTTALTLYRHRELDQHRIVHEVIRDGDRVLEIGANIGYYAIMIAKLVGPTGFVEAYEPDPRNVKFLKRNARLNGLEGQISIHDQAISDRSGQLDLHVSALSNLNTIERSIPSEGDNLDRDYVEAISVEVTAIGDLVANDPVGIDVIRMDVEGHEVAILAGLASYLESHGAARAPRAIIFEPHSWEYKSGCGIRASLQTLVKHGYNITRLGSRDEDTSPMHDHGLIPNSTRRELRGVTRGIYDQPPMEIAVELASSVDGVTTVCLERAVVE